MFSDEEEDEGRMRMDDPQRILQEFLINRAEKETGFIIDYMSIMQDLESDLPQIPLAPEAEKVNPPPYAQPRIIFGPKKLLPKKDDDKKKKKKKQKMKLPKTKKGEKKPYIYPYQEYPPRPPETDKRDLELNELKRVENAPFTDNIKNDQCNPGIAPTIIKEVYMPFKSSNPEISTFIESALVYQNSAHYEQALESFEKA